jgi:uncharacterized membrane protein YgdD (TMEM256/DUF423 family)
MVFYKLALLAGSLLGATGVALGALAAHSLEKVLTPARLESFTTATRYQLWHAVLLIAVGIWARSYPAPGLKAAVWLFMIGTVFFSGSIYGLTLAGWRWLGPVTPLGGVCLIAGWLCLAWAGLKSA